MDFGPPFATPVGRPFPGIDWKIIRITDDPIATLEQAEELPLGEIGELIVRGPVVTTEYVTRTEANSLHKIKDNDTFWHRMGDVGYLTVGPHGPAGPSLAIDSPATMKVPSGGRDLLRFWFCGRKSHRVITAKGTHFTIPCEAIFNQHPWIYRSALVGIGQRGHQNPVVFIEPWPEYFQQAKSNWQQLSTQLQALAKQHAHTATIEHFLLARSFPVDIRHNAKIFREKLAALAARRLRA